MLDKLKQFAETFKSVILYVAGPLLLLVFYILRLKSKNADLETQLTEKTGEAKIEKALTEKEEAHANANEAETEYDKAKSDYLANNKPGNS